MPAIRRTLALGGLASAMIFGAPVAAHADVPIKQVGWWTRSPAPPTVPDGGVSVGAAADGDLTVAAVQIDAGGGASGANLHLVETNGGGQLAGLQVCSAD